MPGMDLSQLFEARRGLPTETEAAGTIATFAVIPAAMAGLLAGWLFVGLADPPSRVAWMCAGGAAAAGFATVVLVLGVHRLCGFRAVVLVADAVAGMLYGLLLGAALSMLLIWGNVFPPPLHNHVWWPLALIPLGAVAGPIVGSRLHGRRAAEAESDDTPPD